MPPPTKPSPPESKVEGEGQFIRYLLLPKMPENRPRERDHIRKTAHVEREGKEKEPLYHTFKLFHQTVILLLGLARNDCVSLAAALQKHQSALVSSNPNLRDVLQSDRSRRLRRGQRPEQRRHRWCCSSVQGPRESQYYRLLRAKRPTGSGVSIHTYQPACRGVRRRRDAYAG